MSLTACKCFRRLQPTLVNLDRATGAMNRAVLSVGSSSHMTGPRPLSLDYPLSKSNGIKYHHPNPFVHRENRSMASPFSAKWLAGIKVQLSLVALPGK